MTTCKRGSYWRLTCMQYAMRVRTIKNDVSRNEVSKDVIKLRQQVRDVSCCMQHIVTIARPQLSVAGRVTPVPINTH
jgi:hypothetical protein